ncbi:MAG: hypothetical protein JRD68_08600 [Deltaproteobacteria bacterium]|nr:hypothetical protein [Deltaproteobacteria bacterium]
MTELQIVNTDNSMLQLNSLYPLEITFSEDNDKANIAESHADIFGTYKLYLYRWLQRECLLDSIAGWNPISGTSSTQIHDDSIVFENIDICSNYFNDRMVDFFIATYFKYKNQEQVKLFLTKNRNIAFFLVEAHREITKIFVTDTLSLEVLNDPEIEGQKEMTLDIITNKSPRMALDLLDQLDNNWWLNALDKVGKNFIINLDYE